MSDADRIGRSGDTHVDGVGSVSDSPAISDSTSSRAATRKVAMRVAYADPPYPGCAHLYRDHPDYAGEVDHWELARQLLTEFDGFILHTSSPALREVEEALRGAAIIARQDVSWRVMPWVKQFAAFKANVPVAYAWEPVFVKPCRKPVVTGGEVMRDWISEPITMKRGLTGAKPDRVCKWAFEVAGMERWDELVDMFPGTGAVTKAWKSWCSQPRLPEIRPGHSQDTLEPECA